MPASDEPVYQRRFRAGTSCSGSAASDTARHRRPSRPCTRHCTSTVAAPWAAARKLRCDSDASAAACSRRNDERQSKPRPTFCRCTVATDQGCRRAGPTVCAGAGAAGAGASSATSAAVPAAVACGCGGGGGLSLGIVCLKGQASPLRQVPSGK